MHRAAQTAPADPTGITGATAKMLGLAVAFTPRVTGRVLVLVSGQATDDTNADTATYILRYGTGTAPANDAASTGTAGGLSRTFSALTSATSAPFSENQLITGLTLNTAYWFDFSAKATGAGAVANLTTLTFTIMEI